VTDEGVAEVAPHFSITLQPAVQAVRANADSRTVTGYPLLVPWSEDDIERACAARPAEVAAAIAEFESVYCDVNRLLLLGA
jgi:hypothetical protein